MVEAANRQALGPFLLTRALETSPVAERFLAFRDSDHTSHVAFRFAPVKDRPAVRRFVRAVEACQSLRQEHLLGIEYHTIDPDGHPWIVSPFTGDVDGVRTLRRLLRDKQAGGGQMQPVEAERAVEHLLDGVAFAHRGAAAQAKRGDKAPLIHGAMSLDEILIDRHGRLVVELYGLARRLWVQPAAGADAGSGSAEVIRDELRSIAQIGYELLTGLRAEAPMIPAGRIIKRLDPRWERWLARGLDAVSGFESADEALALLPSRSESEGDAEAVGAGGVRAVLGRFRSGRW